jgi:thiamine-phosphate pyrophosphorylase
MPKPDGMFRVLDANANRAREGLRVVEEYIRLVKNNVDYTARLKQLRHDVTAAVGLMQIDRELIEARQSDTDVGAGSPSSSEGRRADLEHIVTANLRRSQEALRVLEEYSKLLSANASAEFKRIRFEVYTIEKLIRLDSRQEGGNTK